MTVERGPILAPCSTYFQEHVRDPESSASLIGVVKLSLAIASGLAWTDCNASRQPYLLRAGHAVGFSLAVAIWRASDKLVRRIVPFSY
jgi:hypothetical protein